MFALGITLSLGLANALPPAPGRKFCQMPLGFQWNS